MPKEKVATGFISHEGSTFNVSEITSIGKDEFVKNAMEQSTKQPEGVHVNYSNFGDAQKSMLERAWDMANEQANPAPTPAPAPALKQAKDKPTAE